VTLDGFQLGRVSLPVYELLVRRLMHPRRFFEPSAPKRGTLLRSIVEGTCDEALAKACTHLAPRIDCCM
jgi:hypothetical protein